MALMYSAAINRSPQRYGPLQWQANQTFNAMMKQIMPQVVREDIRSCSGTKPVSDKFTLEPCTSPVSPEGVGSPVARKHTMPIDGLFSVEFQPEPMRE